MYEVLIGENTIYYPGNSDYAIYDTELDQEVGKAGEFTFKVPSQNPYYSLLTTGKLVTILKNRAEYWRGEIKDISVDFNKVATVYCLEDLAFLADEYLTPVSRTNQSYAQCFQAAIDQYNSARPAESRFTAGYITNVNSSDVCDWITEYDMSILDCLRDCICKDSGYLRVRRENGQRYIDIIRLQDFGDLGDSIEYGFNILNFIKDSDYENLTNVLTPYGDELEDQEVYEGYAKRLQGTTIQNAASINSYGRHAKAVIFDGVEDSATLNRLASAYLSRYSQPQLTLEVTALDLAQLQNNVNEIEYGQMVRVVCEPFAIDQLMFATKIRRDLQSVDKNKITLSGEVQAGKTLTSQAQEAAEAVKNLPSKNSILDAAKRNALAILNGAEGGYVTFETNEDDQITELRIANNIKYEQATKCWRWNLGGLAFLERQNTSQDWTIRTAATMDGGFVADFITTGNLVANNGVYELNMSTGHVKMSDGDFTGKITSSSGTIGGFSIGATELTRGDALVSRLKIGCGEAGYGIANLVGGSRQGSPYNYGYIQLSNSGDPTTCRDGIRIFGDGSIRHYNASGTNDWSRSLNAIPT